MAGSAFTYQAERGGLSASQQHRTRHSYRSGAGWTVNDVAQCLAGAFAVSLTHNEYSITGFFDILTVVLVHE